MISKDAVPEENELRFFKIVIQHAGGHDRMYMMSFPYTKSEVEQALIVSFVEESGTWVLPLRHNSDAKLIVIKDRVEGFIVHETPSLDN